MNNGDRTEHWEEIYQQSNDKKVGWYQAVPTHSLAMIDELPIEKGDSIIDVGADSPRKMAKPRIGPHHHPRWRSEGH